MFGKMKDTLRMIAVLKPFFGQLEDFKDAVFAHISKGTPIAEEMGISFIAAAEALLSALKGEQDNGGKNEEDRAGETIERSEASE